jgi:hypothetical protein
MGCLGSWTSHGNFLILVFFVVNFEFFEVSVWLLRKCEKELFFHVMVCYLCELVHYKPFF